MNLRLVPVLALLAIAGCNPPMTAEKVNTIQLCRTTFAEITDMFGTPTHKSRMGELNVHAFDHGYSQNANEASHRLVLAYNDHDVVVDILFDVPTRTIASISDHCKGKPSPEPAAPSAAPSE